MASLWSPVGKLGRWRTHKLNTPKSAADVDPNATSTCWPVVDNLLLKTIQPLTQNNNVLLPNGGFELGPAIPESSEEGVLLISEPSLVESALQQWTTTGTVKYINSKNYYVPQGIAAVEIVSGVLGGIQTEKSLSEGSQYTLEFMLEDANNSCSGEFLVGVLAGSSTQNFSLQSNGTGEAKKYSMTFKGGPSSTPISFLSYKAMQREDGVFCGPVIDAVELSTSVGHKITLQPSFIFSLLLVALLLMS